MPTIARVQTEAGPVRFVRLCWCCRETGVATPVVDDENDYAATPDAAAAMHGKCGACFLRARYGLPTGRRIDA